MIGNRIFNGVLAIHVCSVRGTVGFKLAVLFCKSRRKDIHGKIAKCFMLSFDIFIGSAFNTPSDRVHVVALDFLKVVEDFI